MNTALAKLGLRLGTLGTAASLAIAAPIANGNFEPSAHTYADRIGFYFSRTAGAEKVGVVVMGFDVFGINKDSIAVDGSVRSNAGSVVTGVNLGAGNQTLTARERGYVYTGSTDVFYTLPAANSLPAGTVITIAHGGTAGTVRVITAGSDQLYNYLYENGTVSPDNTTTLNGTSTRFLSLAAGDTLRVRGVNYTIASVISALQVTTTVAVPFITGTSVLPTSFISLPFNSQAGTVTTDGVTTTVTGVGTSFSTSSWPNGLLRINGVIRRIVSVASGTSLQVDAPFPAFAGQSFATQLPVGIGAFNMRTFVTDGTSVWTAVQQTGSLQLNSVTPTGSIVNQQNSNITWDNANPATSGTLNISRSQNTQYPGAAVSAFGGGYHSEYSAGSTRLFVTSGVRGDANPKMALIHYNSGAAVQWGPGGSTVMPFQMGSNGTNQLTLITPGGSTATNQFFRIQFTSPLPSTDSLTGAFQVYGDVGITGIVNIGGTTTAPTVIGTAYLRAGAGAVTTYVSDYGVEIFPAIGAGWALWDSNGDGRLSIEDYDLGVVVDFLKTNRKVDFKSAADAVATNDAAVQITGGLAVAKTLRLGGAAGIGAIGATTPVAGMIQWTGLDLEWYNGTIWQSLTAGGGGGSVTSVGLALPAEFSITGSPVTTTGTLTGAWANQNANLVFAGPTTGPAGTPSFRALVAADIPLATTQVGFGSATNTLSGSADFVYSDTYAVTNPGTGNNTKLSINGVTSGAGFKPVLSVSASQQAGATAVNIGIRAIANTNNSTSSHSSFGGYFTASSTGSASASPSLTGAYFSADANHTSGSASNVNVNGISVSAASGLGSVAGSVVSVIGASITVTGYSTPGTVKGVAISLLNQTATAASYGLHIQRTHAAAAVPTMYGIAITNSGSGHTTTDMYGVYVGPIVAGTITNSYGLYIDATGGAPTSRYGIFQAGSGGLNVFAGVTSVTNVTTATLPNAAAFVVSGGVGIGDNLIVSSNIQNGAGSALSPSYRFFADTTSGFFRAGPNQIGIAISGVERHRFADDTFFSPFGVLNFGATTVGVNISLSAAGNQGSAPSILTSGGFDPSNAPNRAYRTTSSNASSTALFTRMDITGGAADNAAFYAIARHASGTYTATSYAVVGDSNWASGANVATTGNYWGAGFQATSGITNAAVTRPTVGAIRLAATANGASNAASAFGISLSVTAAASSTTAQLTEKTLTIPSAFTGTTIRGIGVTINWTGTASTTATTVRGIDVAMTVNQGAALGYTGILLNVTETAVGSGNKLLMDLQTGSTSRFSVRNDGLLTSTAGRVIGVQSIVSAAGTTVLTATDHFVCVTGTTTQTLTLPAASNGRWLLLKSRSTGTVTVNRSGGDTIDGGTTINITAGNAIMLVANGSDWTVN